jgi:hypothetical protein
MRKALLDFPWDLAELSNGYSPVLDVLLRFQNLISRHRLVPVPFLSDNEYSDLFKQVPRMRPGGANAFQQAARLLGHCVRPSGPGCLATPVPGPTDLRDTWRFALRESMIDTEDWRTPQIVFSDVRKQNWLPSTPERAIRFEPCDTDPDSGTYDRVLACLEEYDGHRYAMCDFDPWDLRWMYPPEPEAPQHQRHPCRLPKPPACETTALESLVEELHKVRDWHIGDRYYFVPPRDWRPEANKERWRQWRAFPNGGLPGNDHHGPMDYKGQPWWWDRTHRHWDVQLTTGGYWSISDTGILIATHD